MTRPVLGHGREVTLVRRAVLGVDPVGNDVRGEVATVVGGASWWPTVSTEDNANAETVTAGLSLLLPPGTNVDAVDRVRVDGELFTIQGRPAVWERSPLSGSSAGVLVTLRRVTG